MENIGLAKLFPSSILVFDVWVFYPE